MLRQLSRLICVHRICVQTVLAAVALAVLPLLALSLFLNHHTKQTLLDLSARESTSALNELERLIQNQVQGYKTDVLTMADYPPIDGIYRAQNNGGIDPVDNSTLDQWRGRLSTLFSDYARLNPGVQQVRYLDSEGREWLRINADQSGPRNMPEATLQDKSGRMYFVAAAALPPGKCFVSTIDLNVDHGRVQPENPVLRISTPLWQDEALQGVLVINISAKAILEQIKLSSTNGRIVFATDTGAYMWHSDPNKRWGEQLQTGEGLYKDWPELAHGKARAQLLRSESKPIHLTDKDQTTYLTLAHIRFDGRNAGWIIGVERDQSEMLASAYAMNRFAIGATIGVGVLAVGLALLWSMTWLRPLRQIFAVDKAIREGNYQARVPELYRGELGQLAESFNRLASGLEQAKDAEELRKEAEQANRAKSEFLANMSHEIRTPMTAILGFTDLLADPSLSESERAEQIDIIHRNGEHLLTILNDILDLSKIESGKMTTESIPASINLILEEVRSLMRPRATAKNLTFDVRARPDVPPYVMSDPVRLRQILLNLVGNAIKFTAQGGIQLFARVDRATTPGHTQLVFEVVDSGIGIPQEKIEHLFSPFCQADDSTTRRFGGTGLGLTLSRRFAQMLGGDLTVKSTPGQGSVFTLTIVAQVCQETVPQPKAKTAPRLKLTSEPLSGHVLLAEDGPDNQRLITTLLQKFGLDVELVENGAQAVERALAAQKMGTPFDLILMDIQMPEMDGYTAARALRTAGYAGRIIALTANTMSGDREKCLSAGCDDHVSKPISKQQLYETASRLLSPRAAA